MTLDASPSRRRVLQLVGGLATGALSGCLGFLTGADASAIENVTFQGKQVVAHVADDTNADAIDFRSPNDELLHTASIGRKNKVSFSLYKDTNTPYSPGDYTLVAVKTSGDGDSETLETRSISLTSSFSVADVRPIETEQPAFDTSDKPLYVGPVQITIENTGTLPVGIKYIGFPNHVPSPDTPPSPSSTKQNYQTVSGSGHFVDVDTQTTFESWGAPLRYTQSAGSSPDQSAIGDPNQSASWQQIKNSHCNGAHHTATLVVVPWHGSTHKRSVTFQYAGNASRRRSLGTEFGCTNVSVVNSQPMNTSTTAAQ